MPSYVAVQYLLHHSVLLGEDVLVRVHKEAEIARCALLWPQGLLWGVVAKERVEEAAGNAKHAVQAQSQGELVSMPGCRRVAVRMAGESSNTAQHSQQNKGPCGILPW